MRPWSVQLAFTCGTVRTPSTTAFAMNAAGERSKPSRAWNSCRTFSRYFMSSVTSTGMTACACGALHAWTMLFAIARRICVSGTSVSPERLGTGAGRAGCAWGWAGMTRDAACC